LRGQSPRSNAEHQTVGAFGRASRLFSDRFEPAGGRQRSFLDESAADFVRYSWAHRRRG
jgi:hypothetical protein